MKRIICALMVFMLLAGAALGEEFATKYFTVTMPDDWEAVYDYATSDANYWDLGYMGSNDDQLAIFASISYYSSWKNFSLWRADEEEMDYYLQILLADYDDYDCKYMETVTVGKIPFIIIKLIDDGDVFYYAETMTNGYTIELELNAYDQTGKNFRDVSDEEYGLFIEILKTFKPVM